jgi:NADH pyrophosphatase NudC (nudix superfamily)
MNDHDYKDENLNDYQKSEVSEIKWASYEECLKLIRPYNLEKIEILKKINNVLNNYSLY